MLCGPKAEPCSDEPYPQDPTPEEIEERTACIRPKYEKATPVYQPRVYEPRVYPINPDLINQLQDPREC